MDIFKLILQSRAQGFSCAIPTGFNWSYLAFLIYPIIYSHMPHKALKASEFSFRKNMLFKFLFGMENSWLNQGAHQEENKRHFSLDMIWSVLQLLEISVWSLET